MSNFMNIRPVGAELFHADGRTDGQTDGRTDRQRDRQTDGRTDGQTDITKLIVAFSNFYKIDKEYTVMHKNSSRSLPKQKHSSTAALVSVPSNLHSTALLPPTQRNYWFCIADNKQRRIL
jgi:hypothetical protein